ncbi:MAG: RpiB/LacA/LacB family sugar-phosphate isomerase [Lactobacillales bacterium]|jgi:ribose 5-phosphate isomerase RpiB|nr:RpiB/LacA/LacB family sugar-phosphate isomerase [Lactobacillales bacterium]
MKILTTDERINNILKEITNHEIIYNNYEGLSYVEKALELAIKLNRKEVDFVITGCSSGQGMMLALNALPGVICGFAPTPIDAYLFGRINNGNAISVTLGEEYGYKGIDNLRETLKQLFNGEFGTGWPEEHAERKRVDAQKVKELKEISSKKFEEILPELKKLLGI